MCQSQAGCFAGCIYCDCLELCVKMGHHLSNQAQMFSGWLEAFWVVWQPYRTVYVQWTQREDFLFFAVE